MSQQMPSILFGDDNQGITFTYELIIASWGYNVIGEMSPRHGLHYIKADPGLFDLVIADYNMPEMKGDALLAEILRLRPDLPTILITGHSEEITEEQAQEVGIRTLLMKPILPQILAATIEKAAGKRDISSIRRACPDLWDFS